MHHLPTLTPFHTLLIANRGEIALRIMRSARALGYRRMTLWTNDILVAARGIYRAAGFRLTASAPHSKFGPPMVGEDWERDL